MVLFGELMTGDPAILPVLAVAVLPAWLVVTGRPELAVTGEELTSGRLRFRMAMMSIAPRAILTRMDDAT